VPAAGCFPPASTGNSGRIHDLLPCACDGWLPKISSDLRPWNAPKCCAWQTFEPGRKCCLKSTVLQFAAEKSEKTTETPIFCSGGWRLLRTVLWKRLIIYKKTLTYLHSDPTICHAKGFAIQTGCMIGLRSLPMVAENRILPLLGCRAQGK